MAKKAREIKTADYHLVSFLIWRDQFYIINTWMPSLYFSCVKHYKINHILINNYKPIRFFFLFFVFLLFSASSAFFVGVCIIRVVKLWTRKDQETLIRVMLINKNDNYLYKYLTQREGKLLSRKIVSPSIMGTQPIC